jgi:hypothetical protein
MNTEAFLQAQLARPLTHRVTTLYANGTAKTHDTRSLAQAENFAIGERRKVGRELIDRTTGSTVQVLRVLISLI